MSKHRWSIEQKRQHVAAWRASGLTRQQYCELNDIPFKSLREWPKDVGKRFARTVLIFTESSDQRDVPVISS